MDIGFGVVRPTAVEIGTAKVESPRHDIDPRLYGGAVARKHAAAQAWWALFARIRCSPANSGRARRVLDRFPPPDGEIRKRRPKTRHRAVARDPAAELARTRPLFALKCRIKTNSGHEAGRPAAASRAGRTSASNAVRGARGAVRARQRSPTPRRRALFVFIRPGAANSAPHAVPRRRDARDHRRRLGASTRTAAAAADASRSPLERARAVTHEGRAPRATRARRGGAESRACGASRLAGRREEANPRR